MAILHNRVSQDELKKLLAEESDHRVTISFYHYFPVPDPQQFRDELYAALSAMKVFGRIYVAQEGINAQVSVPKSQEDAFAGYIHSIGPLSGVRLNLALQSAADLNDPSRQGKSFWVLKIKVREKIVADGITDPSFSMEKKGRYVNAAQMNELMQNPDTIVIDMRNHYEFEVGHFENAVEIPSDTFREQLPMAVNRMAGEKDKNIVMYCTGGIRCEKASAYLLHHGFNNVFHLEGGIINYSREIREKGLPTRFIGKNFVFDDRLGERVTADIIASCHQCGKPADTHNNCRNSGCHLLFIQCAACALCFDGCCSTDCQKVVQLLPQEQKELRKGIVKDRMVFNKSRHRLRPRLDKPGQKENATE